MCDIGRCKDSPILQYSAFGLKRSKTVGICDKHWEKHCSDNDKFDIRTYFYSDNKK